MHVVLATFGTDGDVFPYLGLGKSLVDRGHQVSLATSPHYHEAATQCGLGFHEIMPRHEIDRVLWNEDFWHPLKAGQLAAQWGLRFIPEQYALLERLVRRPGSVLVANPGVLAARLVHDKQGTPFASVALQPWIFPSEFRPPVLPGALALPDWAPRWVRRLYFRLISWFGDYLLATEVNAFRHKIGLPTVRGLLRWWFSPQLILGLFPAWYGPPQPDWPSQVRLLSFPTFDGVRDAAISPEIDQFIQAGAPPVAVTFGTGIRHARELYANAVEGCRQLGCRAIVITKYAEQLPRPLPEGMIAASYAPFSALLPRCAGIVHHGGIGTTAKALGARVPQLIVPVCFDQLDNALRVKALARGKLLSQRRATAHGIAKALAETLRLSCHLPVEPAATPALEEAAELIGHLARTTVGSSEHDQSH